MRRFQGPNVVVLTRAVRPPIPGFQSSGEEAENDEPPTADTVEGSKLELRGMSKKSSLNFAKLLSTLDWAKNGQCVHVTLTYWKSWPLTKEQLLSEKAGLVRDMGRHCETGVWRLEFQTRAGGVRVPHWHCLVWLGQRSEADFENWLREWWARFSGNPHERGVKVTSGDQARGTWYLAMHAAKREQSPPFAVGRWWGYIQRGKLLAAQDLHETGEVHERERVWWVRLFKRHTGGKVREGKGMSWFLPRSAQTVAFGWIQSRVEDEKRERFKRLTPE
jgi:hypothetical protein